MAGFQAYDKIKIIVVGDSGVGKTSLVHLMCHNEPNFNPGYTIGCSVEVKLHDYKAGTPSEKTYFTELWDIGGSSSHQNSRSIFYNNVNAIAEHHFVNPEHYVCTNSIISKIAHNQGIILVHDLTNRKSHQNLRRWLGEVLNKNDAKDFNSGYDFDPEQFAGNQIPILLVGTKADLAQTLREKVISRSSSIAEECGADEMNLDCNDCKCLSPGSTNAVKLSRFFDKVTERRFYSHQVPPNQFGNVIKNSNNFVKPHAMLKNLRQKLLHDQEKAFEEKKKKWTPCTYREKAGTYEDVS